jgi:hypothetical protein
LRKYLALYTLPLLFSCSKESLKLGLTIEIEKPTDSFSSLAESFTLTEPTSVGELNCVGILLNYPTNPAANPGYCDVSVGGSIPVAAYGGLVRYVAGTSSAVTLNDLQGDQLAHIFAIGFKTDSSTCITLSPSQGPEHEPGNDYSEAYILGSAQTQIRPFATSEVTIPTAFNSSLFVDDCHGAIFNDDDSLNDGMETYFTFDNYVGGVERDARIAYSLNFGSLATEGASGVGGSRVLRLNSATSTGYINSTLNHSGFQTSANSLSLSFWLKAFSGTLSDGVLIQKGDSDDGYSIKTASCVSAQCFITVHLNGGATIAQCADGGSEIDFSTYQNITVTFARDANGDHSVNVYRNGALCGSGSDTASTPLTPTNFTFGDASSATNGALIDNLGVWRRVLTTNEIQRLYNGGQGLSYPF